MDETVLNGTFSRNTNRNEYWMALESRKSAYDEFWNAVGLKTFRMNNVLS